MANVIGFETRWERVPCVLMVIALTERELPYWQIRPKIFVPNAVVYDATRPHREEGLVGVYPAQANDWRVRSEVDARVHFERELDPIDRTAARVRVD